MPMHSPAMPNLTLAHYRVIYDLLNLNPTEENAPIREEIAAYIAANGAWANDAAKRKLANPW